MNEHQAYWHQNNPWADSVVYVPIDRLAEACAAVSQYGTDWWLAHFAQNGRDRLDAYVLPQTSGRHSAGVRYGAEEADYISRGDNPQQGHRATHRSRRSGVQKRSSRITDS